MRPPSPCAASPGRSPRPLGSILIVSMLVLAGCSGGDELPREAVSGEVTLGGEPLSEGMIQFEPSGGQATGGGAVIRDGSYEIPGDTGLVPGSYRVSISSSSGGSADTSAAPGAPGAMMQERIPARYNAQSELVAEVTEGGDNTFDFPLEP
ncbi:hypothetical protein [Tautonia plasticadhaerens]|uniref:Carboxypeptidase regulatory-like domain-containing protein n=1 Tax=Tautonia plasticadhaerens TaxID=2527974 RepID=A0A518HDC5_9BACT|nr:hypothetical protein [Tautonia plasticadhaerens]QDV38861.1 hypothetical protein ElP_68200 [Tautonia plasticadhaerens]